MTHYPDIMRKAQRDIDEVVGRERPPTFDDMPRLPYIRAIVKETLRWRPIAPLGECSHLVETGPADGMRFLQRCMEQPMYDFVDLCSKFSLIISYQDDWYEGYFIPKGTSLLTSESSNPMY